MEVDVSTPKASVILWMVERNLPLGHFRRYIAEAESRNVSGLSSWRQKDWKKTARAIVNGLSQYPVAAQVASEWELFPPLLRMDITNFCGSDSHSGNVRKGIAYLDQLLGGKIRRREAGPTERKLVVVNGTVVSTRKKVNIAVAGAEKAFAIVARPANYDKLSPSQKRRINEEMAQNRRANR